MIQVDFPFVFLLVPFLLAILWVFFREKVGHVFPNPFVARVLDIPPIVRVLFFLRGFFILCLASMLASVNILTHGYVDRPIEPLTTIVFDVSRSMLAEDVLPSRIAVAKNALGDFLLGAKNRKINLIIFSGKPFLLVSHSSDTAGMLRLVRSITPYSILQEKPGLSGTNIGDALLLAIQGDNPENAPHSIVLITDGTPNIGSDPIATAERAGTLGVRIFTVGIGKMDGEPLYYTNENGEKTYLLENGEKVVGNFDPKLLGEIATMTDARYFTADNISELQRVFDEIQELTDSGTESVYAEKKISLTPYFALVLAGLFVAILFCERNFRKKYGVV